VAGWRIGSNAHRHGLRVSGIAIRSYFFIQFKCFAGLIPWRRRTSAIATPASCSRSTPMICSSVNLPPPHRHASSSEGPYASMDGFPGRRSAKQCFAITCSSETAIALRSADGAPKQEVQQLDVQTLHYARERLVGERTTLINQLIAILFDRGITIAKGRLKLGRWLHENLVATLALTPRMRSLIKELTDELQERDAWRARLDREFGALCQADQAAVLLRTVPGIGTLNATAMSAAVRDVSMFGKARHFSAWLGLVPRQITTGGKLRLVAISNRGITDMRVLLIHGARSTLPGLAKTDTPVGVLLRVPLERAKRNVVVVALASKLARIAWAVMSIGRPFGPATALAM
jgi:transposase